MFNPHKSIGGIIPGLFGLPVFGGAGELDTILTLLQTTQAAVDVESLDFSNLDGDTDGVYLVEFSINHALNLDVSLRFNDDSGNGISRRDTLNSTTLAYASTMIANEVSAANDAHEGVITIIAPRTLAGVAKNRRYWCDSMFRVVTTANHSRLYVGQWANSADNLVKISLATETANDGIGEGSWARLYQYAL